MPIYRKRVVFKVARGAKAFLNLDVGLTRGAVPDSEQMLKQAQSQIKQKNQQLKRLREQLASGNRAPRNGLYAIRREVASRYLAGSGLEIGALHNPLEVPSDTKVRYVDRMPVDEMRKQLPELSEQDLVPVDIIEDGETLPSIADASVDFVITNHMIEHCQNPIGTLENHLRVLKPGGILYLAVPDKRFTFDHDRPVTPLKHMIRDYTEGAEWSREVHYEEWIRIVEKVPENELAGRARYCSENDLNIHFHVWTQEEFMDLLKYCQSNLEFPFEIELFTKNEIELIVVLRKQDL